MAKEICISSTPHETRLAILEDDQLAEIYYERENEYTLAGSIYNGRVTRVLPGMQSAFVDLGLERDAFLYVTDFIELEDQEETDELEKAAAAGQAPREVKHPQGFERDGGRQEERGSRQGQKPEPRQDARPERRPAEEAAPATAASIAPKSPGQIEAPEEPEEAGSRRWRGRRRRRGGRGPSAPLEAQAEVAPLTETAGEPVIEFELAAEIPVAEIPAAQPALRGRQAPAAFVLPGESLSRYGGAPAAETERPAPPQPAPARPASAFRPSTLIEAPIEWDGSGLLPGESISRHRSRQPEPEVESSEEPQASSPVESGFSAEPAGGFTQEETLEEALENLPPSREEIEAATHPEASIEFEEESLDESSLEPPADEAPISFETPEDRVTAEEEFEETVRTSEEEADASASHHIDTSSPTGFRLFGFGKKKDTAPAAVSTTASSTSTYAPGPGLVEEEVIEGEELDAAHHPRGHKPDVHDLDDYEEETIPTQPSHWRSGRDAAGSPSRPPHPVKL